MAPGSPARRNGRTAIALILLTVVAGTAVLVPEGGVRAQTARDESVQFRYRPDYLPQGLDLDLLLSAPARAFDVGPAIGDRGRRGDIEACRAWTLFPRLDLAMIHDDNLLRTKSAKRADFATVARPSVYAKADLQRHELALYAQADLTRYRRESTQDSNQARANLDAKLEITDELKATLFVEQARLLEPRGTTTDPSNAPRPTLYHLTTAAVGFAYDGDPWVGLAKLEYRRYTYGDNGAATQFDRNRVEYFAKLRAGYELYEGTIAYIEPVLNQRSYVQRVANDGFIHDSRGYEIQAGIHYDASGVSFLELGLGYLRQTYTDSRFPTASGPSFSAKLVWNPTDVITIIGDAGRRVDETTLSGVANVVNTFANATLDYEIVEELIASVKTGWTQGRYGKDAAGFQRDDRVVSYGDGLRYLAGPNLQFALDWTRADRSSNLSGVSYVANTVIGTVILQW